MTDLAGTLCHYTVGTVAFEHILPSGTLRMSPYARMRDPLENRELSFCAAPGNLDADVADDKLSSAAFFIELVRSTMSMLCFTADAGDPYGPDDEPFMRAWARPRMWEQYGGAHQGVCLLFERDLLLERISDELQPRGMVVGADVSYVPRGFSGTAAARLDLESFDPYDLPKLARFVLDSKQDLFFTKSLDWEAEHEFRVMFSPEKKTGEGPRPADYVLVPFGDASAVRAVVLGEKYPDSEMPRALTVCEEHGLELLRVRWEAGVPSLVRA